MQGYELYLAVHYSYISIQGLSKQAKDNDKNHFAQVRAQIPQPKRTGSFEHLSLRL